MKLIGPVSRRAWNTHNSHLHGVDLGVRHGLESRTASRESKFGNLASAKLCIMISRILYLKISITLKSCLESYQRFGISYAAFSWWTPRSRQGNSLPHVTKEEEAIKARVIYDSAFHPDTSAKINVFGRMSSRVPCGTFLVGALLTFYTWAVVLTWAWIITFASYCYIQIMFLWLKCSSWIKVFIMAYNIV